MPLVTMHMYPGRTPERKAGEVLLIEVPREDWGSGGNLANQQTAAASTT